MRLLKMLGVRVRQGKQRFAFIVTDGVRGLPREGAPDVRRVR
jgi:hypothetical protein